MAVTSRASRQIYFVKCPFSEHAKCSEMRLPRLLKIALGCAYNSLRKYAIQTYSQISVVLVLLLEFRTGYLIKRYKIRRNTLISDNQKFTSHNVFMRKSYQNTRSFFRKSLKSTISERSNYVSLLILVILTSIIFHFLYSNFVVGMTLNCIWRWGFRSEERRYDSLPLLSNPL